MTRKPFSSMRGLYKQYPALYSLIELSIFLGLYFGNVWVAPFWFWGIYRLNIHVPHTIEKIFFFLWHMSPYLVAPSVMLGLSVLIVTLSVRKDPLKELGIRFDNLKSSGRECLITFLIGGSLIVIVFLFHLEDFTSSNLKRSYLFISYPLWGVAQQFLLQSIFFIRLLQILKNKKAAIVAAAVIFSLLHAPGIPLMAITFIAGLCCCILFSRHRNIFTLGMFHAAMAGMAFVLLVPGVIDNYTPGPIPGGSTRNHTKFVAYLKYEGDPIMAKPSRIIKIPIEVANKSTTLWDSNEKQHPVNISYHLLDGEGNMIKYDTVRTPFPHPVKPGESLTLDLTVIVPPDFGLYQLEIDIVKERMTWFKDHGSLTIHIPLVVSDVASPFHSILKR